MNLAETEFALGNSESAAARAQENLGNEALLKSPEMHATQAANLAVYLFALGKSDDALAAALDAIRYGTGSFVAVPLQHIAAIISPTEPKRAARLLGYVDAAFKSAAFSRQYTETYTYNKLLASLNEALDADALTEYMRDGASMNDKHAVLVATGPTSNRERNEKTAE
jgi:tetratricopeptide (TPR) repeat protein